MIRTKPPSDEYRDGWDRVFGEVDAECCVRCGGADLVGYWSNVKPDSSKDSWLDAVHRGWYPNAQKCLGCGHTMPNGAAAERLSRERVIGAVKAHASDCPLVTGDGSCRCPMGNL